MNGFTKEDEIDFLKGYIQLSPEARVLEVKALWDNAKNMEPCDKRAMLYLLAIESFFMQQEALYKFLKATRAATIGKDYLNTLMKSTFNPKQDIALILSAEDLGVKYPPKITRPEKEKIEKRVNNIIKTCRDLVKPNEIFSDLYYSLKHGFLIYKKNEDILPLMHKEKEKRFYDFLKKRDIKGQENSFLKNDFSYLIDLNRRVAYAIQDVVAIRLIQLGVTVL